MAKKHKRPKRRPRVKKRAASSTLAAEAFSAVAADIEVEAERSVDKPSFQNSIGCLYGPVKIGKTTLMSLFDGVYFLPTEPGYRWIPCRKTYVPNWATFIAFIRKVERKPKLIEGIKSFCIDTADNLSKFCMQYACGRHDISHPKQLDWGEGWEAFRDEFMYWILRLSNLGPGLWFVSHEQEREVISRSMKITKISPALPKTTYTIINNLSDIILYMGWQIKKRKKASGRTRRVVTRCLFTKPSESRDSGDRTGVLPDEIPFKTEKEAVAIIRRCFKKGGPDA